MKCPCCNKFDVINKLQKLTEATAPVKVCIVCNELIAQSAFTSLETYLANGGSIPKNFEEAPFNYTNEQIIKAVENYKSHCKPNSYGDEDDGYHEHMSEMNYIIEEAEKGVRDMKEVCSELCFNPARHIKVA